MITAKLMAPAKVNLFLSISTHIVEGRHELETVFHTLGLADELTIFFDDSSLAAADDAIISLALSYGPDISPVNVVTEDNLVVKALRAFARQEERLLPGAIHINLVKNIPAQAGLGGGSSDAAAALLALAALWGLDPTGPQCQKVASELGSDIAFFLQGCCAYMTGAGNTLQKVLSPFANCPIVLVKPAGGVATGACYKSFDNNPAPQGNVNSVLEAVQQQENSILARSLFNNLSAAAYRLENSLSQAVSYLQEQPQVLGACLSGSGSAVFGIVEDSAAAQELAVQARLQGYWSQATCLSDEGLRIISWEQREDK